MLARSVATRRVAKRRHSCHDWCCMEYKSGSSTRHRILVHLVWLPKYRRRVLFGKIAIRLKQLLLECCEINDWQIHELAIQKDHVHLLLQINPKESVSKVVNLLKGGTSRAIRREFPEIQEFLWGNSFWADGYFAESVGIKNESIMRKYIQHQS